MNRRLTYGLSRRRFLGLSAAACLGSVFGLAGCDADDGEHAGGPSNVSTGMQTRQGFFFDTHVSVGGACDGEALEALLERCAYFESILSRTVEGSDIDRINKAGGAPVEVAFETADLIAKALVYCEESGGLFDITIGAASSLWDFHNSVVPDPDQLAEAVRHIDYRKVRVDGQTVTLADPEAKLDLGGIAKGYIADDLIDMLAGAGCENGYVNLGGNVKTLGTNLDGSPWDVGIMDPNNPDSDSIVAQIESVDTSVVTSGLYERQFELEGKRYWHILDPATGWPVSGDVISASVVSDASIDGDGYTKPLFLLDRQEAIAFIDQRPWLQALMICADGTFLESANSQFTF